MRVIWTWKDFLVYKYNGIPFAAHLASKKGTGRKYNKFIKFALVILGIPKQPLKMKKK